jgi:hypothetical protein
MGLMDMIFKAIDADYQGLGGAANTYADHPSRRDDTRAARRARRDADELGSRVARHRHYEDSARWSTRETTRLYGHRQEEHCGRESGGGGFWW